MISVNPIASVPIQPDNHIYLEALMYRGGGSREAIATSNGYAAFRFSLQTAHEINDVHENITNYD